MTKQEAVDIIKVARSEVEWEYPMDYSVAFDVVIKEMERIIAIDENELLEEDTDEIND
jgi:hypothetical protein